jgi:1-acyl-sn-glycerol-3-phosphate acyltransferase
MQQRATSREDQAERLLRVVAELDRELHPRRAISRITLDSRFDRDLGFDSLARMELMLRVERAFDRSLPETLLGSADTPRDFLNTLALQPHAMPARIAATQRAPALEVAEAEAATDAATLLDVLDWHAGMHPDRVHIVIVRENATGLAEETITHRELRDRAQTFAANLQTRGLQTGEAVAIMLPTGRDYFFAFFGILLAGGMAVPLYPPLRASHLEDHLRRQAGILSNCQARVLITFPEAKTAARLLRAHAPALRTVMTASELSVANQARPRPGAGDLALLQYTSGSTGNPKGVMLTHANLLANIRAMGRAVQASAADVFVSWLPLYHDMGLIGAWLGSLYYGARLVIMSPLAFLSRPARWLWAIHHYHGTLSAAPNFAYELCAGRIDDSQIEGLDLSSWRLAFNGAETVSANTISAFAQRFGRYRFSPTAMTPVYGLAECCVGLAFPPIGRGPVMDSIDRGVLMRESRATPLPAEDPRALRVVACGLPIPEHDIRIVDETGHEVADRVEGRLQFKGPSATQGYYRNPDATRELLHGEWLDSGDLAYAVNGEIYVTGRIKDVIIRAGRHLHPQEIEEAVGAIDSVRRGCVAVFGSPDPRHGTERLIVLAETRMQGTQELEALRSRIRDTVVTLIGEPPDDVVLAPPHSVPKTSSGKLRRQASRNLYERGDIGRPPPSPAWQAVRFACASALPLLRRARRATAGLVYAGYAWTLFGAAGSVIVLSILVLPGLARRRRLAQAIARLLVRLTRTPLAVHGRERLSARAPCVLVSNHASYADVLVLLAALPPGFPYAFLAKRELEQHWAANIVLQRTGALLVERTDIERSVRDAQEVVTRLRGGDALVVFAEGTLRRTAGLLPFHLGGFVAAAQTRVPVVPIAIRGTRTVLRGDQWFPRHGPVTVSIGEPIMTPPYAESDFAAALLLRDAAREYILEHCGEPDLAD